MNRKQLFVLCQVIVLSYDGQVVLIFFVKGDVELVEVILVIVCDYEVLIYENVELVCLFVCLEFGDVILEVLYCIIVEIIVFVWYLKGKCFEGFVLDVVDGNQMLLFGGFGD